MTFNATDPSSHVGKTDTWLTPMWIIKALGDDFHLDPCGFPEHFTAKHLYVLPKDGLKEKWYGKVWLNPPYSKAKQWLDKMKEHRNGSALLFARTGTLGEYMKDCDHIFLLRKRVRFLDDKFNLADSNPGSDSMILSWGNQDYSKLLGVQIK
jgi:phage N-6-adenine-methyltransferase